MMRLRSTEGSVLTIAKPIVEVADRHMTVAELGALLVEHRVSTAAVTDRGKVVGLAHRGLVALVGGQRHVLVRDVMTPLRATLDEDGTVVEAAAKMAAADVSDLLVVSATGAAISVVSSRDVLGWFAQRHGLVRPDRHVTWRLAAPNAR